MGKPTLRRPSPKALPRVHAVVPSSFFFAPPPPAVLPSYRWLNLAASDALGPLVKYLLGGLTSRESDSLRKPEVRICLFFLKISCIYLCERESREKEREHTRVVGGTEGEGEAAEQGARMWSLIPRL